MTKRPKVKPYEVDEDYCVAGEGGFPIWQTSQEHLLIIELGHGKTIKIDNEGNFQSDMSCSKTAQLVWDLIAALAPLSLAQKNGIKLAQSKLYAISKIRALLVEKKYEVAEHFATAVLEGKE